LTRKRKVIDAERFSTFCKRPLVEGNYCCSFFQNEARPFVRNMWGKVKMFFLVKYFKGFQATTYSTQEVKNIYSNIYNIYRHMFKMM
jgi:hypothetical protein